MLEISENDLLNRMRRDNLWWETGTDKILEKDFPKRDFFPAFYHLVGQKDIRRAVVLMGPRQVGKTVMAKQAILELLKTGVEPNHILFASLDTPLLIGQPLEKLLRLYLESFGDEDSGGYVFFDEIQYLKDWEIHLKSLVDSYPKIKFIVTGSAAAVLKRKSQESGAGRFTDFILPPLTFCEFLKFQGVASTNTFEKLNKSFLDYLAYGGYPEIVRNSKLRNNVDQYLKSDIIDKVLLRDLPSLYGITDVQEMHRLFSSLVYNTAQEVSLSKLSHNSGVSKATLKKYIDYFEGAFLIRKLSRVDDTAKNFKRERTFKIYVTNPSLYSALFGPPEIDDPKMGALAETALVAQFFGTFNNNLMRYARWKTGEVDLVLLDPHSLRPFFACEIKWSDRVRRNLDVANNLVYFCEQNPSLGHNPTMTTKTYEGKIKYRGILLDCIPTAKACKNLGQAAINELYKNDSVEKQMFLDFNS